MVQKVHEKRPKVYEFLLLTVWGPPGEEYEKKRCQKQVEKILYAWSPEEWGYVVEPFPKEETKSNYHIHFILWFGTGKRKNISKRLISKTALIMNIPDNGVHYKSYGKEKTDTVRRMQAAVAFLDYCTGGSKKESKQDYYDMQVSSALDKVLVHITEKLEKATAHKEKTGADLCDPVKYIQSLIFNGKKLKKIAISIAHSYKMEPTPDNFKTFSVLTARLHEFIRFENNYKEIRMWEKYDARPPPNLDDWQEKVVSLATVEAVDDRTVNVVVGQGGKSTIARVLESKFDAAVLPNAQIKDAAESYFGEPIVVIDLPKCHNPKKLNYKLLENFKDGRLWKSKYSSYTKLFAPPQVWVFTNKHLLYNKLTSDTRKNNRWRIWVLNDNKLTDETETYIFSDSISGDPGFLSDEEK